MQAKTLIHTENERKKNTLQQRITFRYFQNQQIAYESAIQHSDTDVFCPMDSQISSHDRLDPLLWI